MKLSAAEKKKVKAKLGLTSSRVSRRSGASRAPRVPRAPRIKGNGDYYVGPMQPRTKSLFKGIGANVGEAILGTPGRYLGGLAHAAFKKITGHGDYKISSNSIVTGKLPPSFGSRGRAMTIQHREYIGDVFGSTSFAIQSFPVNAGLPTTFPWLSQVAANFEQYCIRGMLFEFKSMSADALNSTNTALGTVIMATQYNSVNPAFTSKAAMENYEFNTSGRPSQSFVHPIECARGETPVSCLYTRNGTVPTGADQRLYDLGVFYIATQGMQAVANIGELHVVYDIELLKPKLFDTLGSSDTVDHYVATTAQLATVTDTDRFGTIFPLNKQPNSNLGSSITATNQISLPSASYDQYFVVFISWIGASTLMNFNVSFTTSTGVSVLSNQKGGTANRVSINDINETQILYTWIKVAGNSVSPSMTLSAGNLPTALTSMDIFLTSTSPLVLTQEGGSSLPRVVRRSAGHNDVDDDDVSETPSGVEEDGESADDIEAILEFLKRKKKKSQQVGESKSIPMISTHPRIPGEALQRDEPDSPVMIARSNNAERPSSAMPIIPQSARSVSRK